MAKSESANATAVQSDCSAVSIGIDVVTQSSPTRPDAKRGHSEHFPRGIRETREQLDADLIWWPCSFCGRKVLVHAYRRTRERCQCGAVRCRKGRHEGWRKGADEWWFI